MVIRIMNLSLCGSTQFSDKPTCYFLIGFLLMVHQDSCHPNRCPHIIIPGHLGTGHHRALWGGVYHCISNEKKWWKKCGGILKKYTMTLTLKMGIANLGRSYCVFLKSSIKFHTAMSIQWFICSPLEYTESEWSIFLKVVHTSPMAFNDSNCIDHLIQFKKPIHMGAPTSPAPTKRCLHPRSIVLGTESDMAIPGSKLPRLGTHTCQ